MAYRYLGQWYFSVLGDDDAWVRSRIGDEGLSSDMTKYLEVDDQPGCPVRILDLSVKIDPQSVARRKVTFRVLNKSRKLVTRVAFRFQSPGNSDYISVGTSTEIRPGEGAPGPENLSYNGYGFYCEGEVTRKLIVDFVSFSGGTHWKPRPTRRK